MCKATLPPKPPVFGKNTTLYLLPQITGIHHCLISLCHSVRCQVLQHLPLGFISSSLHLLPFINSASINFHFFTWLFIYDPYPSNFITCHFPPLCVINYMQFWEYPLFTIIPYLSTYCFFHREILFPCKTQLLLTLWHTIWIWHPFSGLTQNMDSLSMAIENASWLCRRFSIKSSAPQILTHQLTYKKIKIV